MGTSRENRKAQRKARSAEKREAALRVPELEAEVARLREQSLSERNQFSKETTRLRGRVEELLEVQRQILLEAAKLAVENGTLQREAESLRTQVTELRARPNYRELYHEADRLVSHLQGTIANLRMELEVAKMQAQLLRRNRAPSGLQLDKQTFRLLAGLIHPDVHPEARKEKATRAMQFLNQHRPE
jgi:acyl-CoA synthetase (NDP forming)